MVNLAIGMLVRNERNRYLPQVINQIKVLSDYTVILDDASTDGTPEFLTEELKDYPHLIHSESSSSFGKEYILRSKLWEMCVSVNPEWIYIMDADEVVEPSKLQELKLLLSEVKQDSLNFRLYDMWSPTHYRSDALWCAHNFYSRFIVRHHKNLPYSFPKRDHHVGRFPQEVVNFSGYDTSIRIKHMGWSSPEDRLSKFNRYMQYDPNGIWGSLPQYHSILDENPNLIEWVD